MAENERDPQADLELCEAATPGPLRVVKDRDGDIMVRDSLGGVVAVVGRYGDDDAALIAVTPEALPYWIRRCQAAEAEVERLRKIIDDATGYSKDGDGTDLLCKALYGRPGKVADWLGGSEAKMLHDAAKEVERLRAENDSLHVVLQEANDTIERMSREQSEESALARLRAWVQADGTYYRHAEISMDGRKDDAVEPCMCLDISWHGGTLTVWNTPMVRTIPNTIGIGTEDKPASLGEMVDAALERWERKYGEGKE